MAASRRPSRPDAGASESRRAVLRGALAAAGIAAAPVDAADAAPAGAAAALSPRKLALALGSGSLHGHAHVGVMRAFEARGIKPDLIVGTSVGAIVGSLWAAGVDAATVERTADRFGLFDAARIAWPGRGLMRNDRLRETVRELTAARPIESWPIAFGAVATDLASGRRVVIDRGDAAVAVAASACMPVLFEPVEHEGLRLVDGALVEPVPVRAARVLGARRVVAVDIAYRPYDEPVRNVIDAAFQSMHVLINALIAEQIGGADVRIRLELHPLMRGHRDYAVTLMHAGEQAAVKAFPAIVD